jgi:para-nitrobenzyl esterase
VVEARRALGIPYARAARFAAPELLAFDAGRDVSSFGPSAPQPLDSPLESIVPGMRVPSFDEHACLTLNVWAPPGARELPVLVWFPGGSFVIGASAQPVYDGSLFALEQSIVVVTVNYRLGALGFLDARPVGGVANCGVRDAICALQWIHTNIESFGGDPTRVVAFGESAGGGLVLHTLTAATTRGLLAGAIVQSGATFATLDDARAALVLETFATEAGVSELAELTTLDVDAVVKAQSAAMSALLPTVGMMPFHPMVDGDVLTAPPADALRAGAAAGIPLIAGTTADEMALFVDRSKPPPERERLLRRVARYLGIADATATVDAYAQSLATNDTAAIWLTIFSDHEMQAPCHAMIEAQSPHAPAYTYLFTWEGPGVGACHAIDVPFTFGNFVGGWDKFVAVDDAGFELSRAVRSAWAEFARTGHPGWPASPNAMIFGRASHEASAHPCVTRMRAAGLVP